MCHSKINIYLLDVAVCSYRKQTKKKNYLICLGLFFGKYINANFKALAQFWGPNKLFNGEKETIGYILAPFSKDSLPTNNSTGSKQLYAKFTKSIKLCIDPSKWEMLNVKVRECVCEYVCQRSTGSKELRGSYQIQVPNPRLGETDRKLFAFTLLSPLNAIARNSK